jgi:hypothetical protein
MFLAIIWHLRKTKYKEIWQFFFGLQFPDILPVKLLFLLVLSNLIWFVVCTCTRIKMMRLKTS